MGTCASGFSCCEKGLLCIHQEKKKKRGLPQSSRHEKNHTPACSGPAGGTEMLKKKREDHLVILARDVKFPGKGNTYSQKNATRPNRGG